MEFVRREKGRGGGLLYCLIRAARYHTLTPSVTIYIGVSYRTGLLEGKSVSVRWLRPWSVYKPSGCACV